MPRLVLLLIKLNQVVFLLSKLHVPDVWQVTSSFSRHRKWLSFHSGQPETRLVWSCCSLPEFGCRTGDRRKWRRKWASAVADVDELLWAQVSIYIVLKPPVNQFYACTLILSNNISFKYSDTGRNFVEKILVMLYIASYCCANLCLETATFMFAIAGSPCTVQTTLPTVAVTTCPRPTVRAVVRAFCG